MLPAAAVAVPCCGLGNVGANVSGSPSASKQRCAIASVVARAVTTRWGKAPLGWHDGNWFAAAVTVIVWV